MAIWAFLPPQDAAERELIHRSLEEGKSRFGWSTADENDLTQERNHCTDANRGQMFLLRIEKGDWIVHVNVPEQGSCTAVHVTSTYGFDGGIQCPDGRMDFRHCFEVDAKQTVEFSRGDPAVVPTVNLTPRRRYHRVHEYAFHETLSNLKSGTVANLWSKTEPHLHQLTELIHQFNQGKKLETFLAAIFEGMPGVASVKVNGSRWGSDHGADLIIDYESPPLPCFQVVAQVKSFTGAHEDLKAVEQIKTAINHYRAHAGMVITTGEKTPQLEEKIQEVANELQELAGRRVPIELMAFTDVARFVIKFGADKLFDRLPN